MDDDFSYTVGTTGMKVKDIIFYADFFFSLNAASANESLKKYSYMRRS